MYVFAVREEVVDSFERVEEGCRDDVADWLESCLGVYCCGRHCGDVEGRGR